MRRNWNFLWFGGMVSTMSQQKALKWHFEKSLLKFVIKSSCNFLLFQCHFASMTPSDFAWLCYWACSPCQLMWHLKLFCVMVVILRHNASLTLFCFSNVLVRHLPHFTSFCNTDVILPSWQHAILRHWGNFASMTSPTSFGIIWHHFVSLTSLCVT